MLSNLAKTRTFLILSLAVVIVGCASSSAPRKWLDQVEKRNLSGYGGWIKLWLEPDSTGAMIGQGELLVISDDSLFWFDEYTLRAVSKDRIKKLKLELYQSKSGQLSTWTLVGTLSTASHGILSLLTAPLWLLTGIGSTAAASYDPIEKLSKKQIDVPGDRFWPKIRKGARFPAGFPEGLDRTTLTPKPAGNLVRRVKHNEFGE